MDVNKLFNEGIGVGSPDLICYTRDDAFGFTKGVAKAFLVALSKLSYSDKNCIEETEIGTKVGVTTGFLIDAALLLAFDEIERCNCGEQPCKFNTRLNDGLNFFRRNEGKHCFIQTNTTLPQRIKEIQKVPELMDEGMSLEEACDLMKNIDSISF